MVRVTIGALLALALAGCTAPGPTGAPKAARPADAVALVSTADAFGARTSPVAPQRVAPPVTVARSLVELPTSDPLEGETRLLSLDHAYFADSAATYRVAAIPTAHALVTLSTLQNAQIGRDGRVFSKTSGQDGRFAFAAAAPTDRPFLVQATLAGNHRLSALRLPGMSGPVKVDEASTAIVEMLRDRWSDAEASDTQALEDLTASDMEALYEDTASGAATLDLVATGAVPAVEPIKTGNGIRMRNKYVYGFGTRITAEGQSWADRLSDAWKRILGFRPLGLSEFNWLMADATRPVSPMDAIMDREGNTWISTRAGAGSVVMVPSTDRQAFWASSGTLKAGVAYNVAGDYRGAITTLSEYNAAYNDLEYASKTNPDAAPSVAEGFPVFQPARMLLEETDNPGIKHLYMCMYTGNRLMFIPGADLVRYGRTFKAGRLYTIAGYYGTYMTWGTAEVDDPNTTYNEARPQVTMADGNKAYDSPMLAPGSLVMDSRKNLYVAQTAKVSTDLKFQDSKATYSEPETDPAKPAGRFLNHYGVALRVIRASDGKAYTLRLTHAGKPFTTSGCLAMAIREGAEGNHLYMASADRHIVFRVPLPADLASLDTSIPAATEVEIVLGAIGEQGVLASGVAAPTLSTVNLGVPKAHVRLSEPQGLAFDRDGNLLVADGTRVRMMEKAALFGEGKVYTVVGGYATPFVVGDSRFVGLNAPSLRYDPVRGNVLIADYQKGRIYQLWTARGSW